MDTQQIVQMVIDLGIQFSIKLVSALAIFVIGRWAAKRITNIAKTLMQRGDVDQMLQRFLGNLVYAVLLTMVILAAITQLGVQTTSFVAILGAAGLAIGLALQGSLSNFAAGVLIILFRPYKTGDYIEAAGVSGSVESVQVFTTILNTPDNKQVIVPNSAVMSGTITNYSANDTRRVDMVFGVGYEDSLDKVKQALSEIVSSDSRVHKEPAPVIAVAELADNSVNLAVRVWVDTGDYWGVFFDTTETVKRKFDEQGISIPYPQRDVHVYQKESA